MVELLKDERIDDLQCKTKDGKELKIIQNPNWFCFGIDAVLLSSFVDIKNNAQVIDLGTGTGIIPLLLTSKTNVGHIDALEIQGEVADMAKRSVKLNDLENIITIIKGNIVEYKVDKQYDAVVCNPPYKKDDSGLLSNNDKLKISRNEVLCKFSDVALTTSRLLKPQGKMFLIHRPERLVDIIFEMRKNKIEPKKIRFVQSYVDKAPSMVLVEGRKCGNSHIKIEPPLVIYNNDGSYTDEIIKIYGISRTSY